VFPAWQHPSVTTYNYGIGVTRTSVNRRTRECASEGAAVSARRRAELIMTKERRDTLDQGVGAYITMPHYAYEYKCTLGLATINAAPPADL